MNLTYRISLKKDNHRGIYGLFEELHQVLLALNQDYFLMGAFARDFWATIHQLPITRRTNDVDFAIVLRDSSEYEKICQRLLQSFSTTSNPFRFVYRQSTNNIFLDLIPFDQVDHTAIRLHWVDHRGFDPISTFGFYEAYQKSIDFLIDEQFVIKVCSLEGIILLKIIAWNDRPEHRSKDAEDIGFIFAHYFDINTPEIYEHHFELINDLQPFDELVCGARLLGRKLKLFFLNNENLQNNIINILQQNADIKLPSKMAIAMTSQHIREYEKRVNLIQHLLFEIQKR